MNYGEIIKKLSSSQQYKEIAKTKQAGSFLPLKHQIDQDKSELIIMSVFLNFSDEKLTAEMLMILDYMTYLPFGNRGIEFAKDCIKQNGENIDLEEMKKQEMFNILKNNGIEINLEIKNSIEKFCHYMFCDEQDLSQVESLAATIRQIDGELDSLSSQGKLVGADNTREEMIEKILDRIWVNIEYNEKKFNINKFLPKQTEKLNESEIEYLNMIINLRAFENESENN